MKTFIVAAGFALSSTGASAQYLGSYGTGSNSQSHSVSGYTNSRGNYVAPHQSTNPNSTQLDNYSTLGNVNPYTRHAQAALLTEDGATRMSDMLKLDASHEERAESKWRRSLPPS